MSDLQFDQIHEGKPVLKALTLPANIALETFPVKIDGNSVTVEI